MNIKSIAIVLAAVAVGFGAGAWWMHVRLAPEIAGLERAAGESLIADLAKLSGTVPGPALPGGVSPPSRADAATDTGANGTGAPTGASPPRPVSSPAGLSPELNELLGRLLAQDRDFETQKREDSWATPHESKLRQLLDNSSALPAGGSLTQVDCRSTMCRVVVAGVPRTRERWDKRDVSNPIEELLKSLRYGVSVTISSPPNVAVDEYIFIVRPEVMVVQNPGERS